MYSIILIFLLFVIAKSEYDKNSWVLKSNFNYNKPHQAILNLAYPASIAYYYISIIPPNSNYSFIGRFLEYNVYESSLTVYDSNGLLDSNFKSINTFNNNGMINYNVVNENFDVLYVLQRFYLNMDYYDEKDIVNNLLHVFDNNLNYYIPPLNSLRRDYYSRMIYKPLQTLISWISPTTNTSFSEFYLPGEFTGLFPDMNHYYLVALPGIFRTFKVKGYFDPSSRIPYIDFITVDQNKVSTDNGLPFYEFLTEENTYEIYITTLDLDKDNILSFDPKAKIIKWDDRNKDRALIFRMIDYSKIGIANATGPLSPKETKEIMFDFYPSIEIIDFDKI